MEPETLKDLKVSLWVSCSLDILSCTFECMW